MAKERTDRERKEYLEGTLAFLKKQREDETEDSEVEGFKDPDPPFIWCTKDNPEGLEELDKNLSDEDRETKEY